VRERISRWIGRSDGGGAKKEGIVADSTVPGDRERKDGTGDLSMARRDLMSSSGGEEARVLSGKTPEDIKFVTKCPAI
jgi:hypothetical protein